MNNKTVFVRTSKGDAEANGDTSLLFGEAKRAFMLVNNKANVDDLRKQAAPSLRAHLEEILEQLERDDFIRDKDQKAAAVPKMVPKMAVPKMAVPSRPAEPEHVEQVEQAEPTGEEELDFTSLVQAPPQQAPRVEPAAPVEELDFSSLISQPSGQAEAEAKAKAEADARARAETEAKARAAVEARMREAEVRARAEAEARMRTEAEAKAAKAAAEARIRAEAEARMRAETEAKARAAAEARARAEAEARARAETEARTRAEAEAKAKAEAEAKMRAEAEAKAWEQAEAKMRAEAEDKAKARAELEARIRAEAETKARAEAAAKLRAEEEAKAKAEAEAEARRRATQEVDFAAILQVSPEALDVERVKREAEAKARLEVEARMRAEAEAKAKERAAAEAKLRAEADAKARVRAELEAGMRTAQVPGIATGKNQAARSMIATVLFFDVVGYTKQSVAKQIELKGQFNSLISGFIGHVDESQRIILDTGDGAAIGFMQHPEDALDVAMKFRAAVTANNHRAYPELKVRAGIHLGPVSIVKDMNGQLNMVGDGINDAQRIMSFAGSDQIYVSRAYFDVISRLTADSARLFKYGGTLKDKHGREHQVYQVLGEGAAATPYPAEAHGGGVESLLQDLSTLLKESAPPSPTPPPVAPAPEKAPAEWQPMEIPGAPRKTPPEIEAEQRRAAQIKADQAAEAARGRAQQEAAARARAEQEAAMAQQEEAAHKLAADQAKAFAEAEKRAKQQAEAEAKESEREAKKQAKREASEARAREARERKLRKVGRPSRPVPWFMVILILLVLVVGGALAVPYVLPMKDYVADVERELSAQFKQPVHIGGMSAASLPAPRLDLQDVSIGSGQDVKIRHVALYFHIPSLTANIKEIEKAELDDVTMSAASFVNALSLLRATGANGRYPVPLVTLHKVRVSGDVPPLPALDGTMAFDSYGRVSKARLRSDDGKLQVELQPQDKRLGIEVSIQGSSLPMLPRIQFDTLDATGDVTDSVITFSSVSGSLYGGSLKGTATLSWQSGWQLQGRAAVSSMLVEKVAPGLKIEGELDGDGNFAMSADRLSQLANAPRLDGTIRMKEGLIKGMDIAETVRSSSGQLALGESHFDSLSAVLRADNSGQHLKQIRMTSGAMVMTGSGDAGPDGKISSQFVVDLNKVRAGLGMLPLVLGGTVAAPAWSTGR